MKKTLLFIFAAVLLNLVNAQDTHRTRITGDDKFSYLLDNPGLSQIRPVPVMAPAGDFIVFSEDFNEPGLDLPAGWGNSNSICPCRWKMDASPAVPGFYSPGGSLNFNNGLDYNCSIGDFGTIWGYVWSPLIQVSGKPCTISFMYNEQNECSHGGGGGYAPLDQCMWDRTYLIILDENFDVLDEQYIIGTTEWNQLSVEYENPEGLPSIRIGFYFDTYDQWNNSYYGPFIDDIRVTQPGVIPVSNWAVLFGLVLIVLFTVFRLRRQG